MLHPLFFYKKVEFFCLWFLAGYKKWILEEWNVWNSNDCM